MSSNLCVDSDKMLKIEEGNVTFEEVSIKYTFFELFSSSGAKYYAAEVVILGDSALAVLGKDYDTAYRLYEKLVRATVTPCSLQDIVSDNFMEIKYR